MRKRLTSLILASLLFHAAGALAPAAFAAKGNDITLAQEVKAGVAKLAGKRNV